MLWIVFHIEVAKYLHELLRQRVWEADFQKNFHARNFTMESVTEILIFWLGRRDSNPQPLRPKRSALPVELLPNRFCFQTTLRRVPFLR